jgi:D-glycero-D-manno-heptose 1,7-bisphosphate phosphatase
MKIPEQAVVLSGGVGNRLRPLTDTMPKPMAPANGRPFLAYLVEQLRDQGIRRILLLTGYRGEMIHDYFGDGSKFGVVIEYSHGPTEWETGRRLWEARDKLDEQFLLLYSDNIVPFSLAKQADFHRAAGASISLLLSPKTRGNIRVGPSGAVEAYDPTRTAADLRYVEIGYMIVERDAALQRFESPDVSFSTILQSTADRGALAGRISGDAYHSISDIERWKLAERYVAPKRILLIDRDGTINQRAPRGEYTTSWESFRWVDDTVEAMRLLSAEGFRFIVLSNQAGIARGMLRAENVAATNARMVEELAARGIDVIDVYVCPHHWDDGCVCRKPAPGMFFQAAKDHLLRMDRTIYIGDDPRDARAAANAEAMSILIGPERQVEPGGGVTSSFISETLLEAVPWIIAQFEAWESSGSGEANR